MRERRVYTCIAFYIYSPGTALSAKSSTRSLFVKNEDSPCACSVNCDAYVHGARVFVWIGVVTANRNKEGVYRVRERRVYTCIAFYIYSPGTALSAKSSTRSLFVKYVDSLCACSVNCDAYVHGARVFVWIGVVTANRNKEGVYRVRERPVHLYRVYYISKRVFVWVGVVTLDKVGGEGCTA